MKKNSWLPLVVSTITILVLTSLPKVPKQPHNIYFIDKIAHFVIYLFWGFTLAVLWRSRTHHPTLFVSVTLLSILLFPTFDELHQYLIPGRNPSLYDWIFDFLGAVIGFSLFVRLRSKGGESNESEKKNPP